MEFNNLTVVSKNVFTHLLNIERILLDNNFIHTLDADCGLWTSPSMKNIHLEFNNLSTIIDPFSKQQISQMNVESSLNCEYI